MEERPEGASLVPVNESKFKFPTRERVRKDVEEPAKGYLEGVFDAQGRPNIPAIKEHFRREGRLHPDDALRIINGAKAILAQEPNLLELKPPVTIVGDFHGQFYDLLNMFRIAGDPTGTTSYLFLGDYVDRGNFGCEVMLLLYALKITKPTSFWLLRGNHECRHLTDYFNFKQESTFKYGAHVYDAFCDSWDHLPLAALLNGKFLCLHGGLSPEMKTLQDINMVDRVQEPPAFGLMCDLLWADPVPDYNEGTASPDAWTYRDNTARGCSFHYSFRAVLDFIHSNDLFSVIRGHEVMFPGFQMYKQDPKNQFPSLITLFSCPNYCDDHGNKGAVLEYGLGNVMNIKQFSAVEHPYYLPNFGNVISWSLPFVAEKCADFIAALHKMETEEEEAELDELERQQQLSGNEAEQRRERIKQKVLAMGKMQSMFATLRKEKENIVKLKGLTGDNKLPKGVLLQGPNAIQASLEFFERSRAAHRQDEMMPVQKYESQLKSSGKHAQLGLLKKSHEDLARMMKEADLAKK